MHLLLTAALLFGLASAGQKRASPDESSSSSSSSSSSWSARSSSSSSSSTPPPPSECPACSGPGCVVTESVRIVSLCADELCVDGGSVAPGDGNPCTTDEIVDGEVVHAQIFNCCEDNSDCTKFRSSPCQCSTCITDGNGAGWCEHTQIAGCCESDADCPMRMCQTATCSADSTARAQSILFSSRHGSVHLQIHQKRTVSFDGDGANKQCQYTPIEDCCLTSQDCMLTCMQTEGGDKFPVCDKSGVCQCIPHTQFQCTKNADCRDEAAPAGRHFRKHGGPCCAPVCKKGWCEPGFDPTFDRDQDGTPCTDDCDDNDPLVAESVYCGIDSNDTNFDHDKFLKCGTRVTKHCVSPDDETPCPDGQIEVNKTDLAPCPNEPSKLCTTYNCDCCDHLTNNTVPDEQICCSVDCDGVLIDCEGGCGCPCVPQVPHNDDDDDSSGFSWSDWSESSTGSESSTSSTSTLEKRKRSASSTSSTSSSSSSSSSSKADTDARCSAWAETPLNPLQGELNATHIGCANTNVTGTGNCCVATNPDDIGMCVDGPNDRRKRAVDCSCDECDLAAGELCADKTCVLDCDGDGLGVCLTTDDVETCCNRILQADPPVLFGDSVVACCQAAFDNQYQINFDQLEACTDPETFPAIPIIFDNCNCSKVEGYTGFPVEEPPHVDQCECAPPETLKGNYTLYCYADKDKDCVPACEPTLICVKEFPTEETAAALCEARGMYATVTAETCDCDDENKHAWKTFACVPNTDDDDDDDSSSSSSSTSDESSTSDQSSSSTSTTSETPEERKRCVGNCIETSSSSFPPCLESCGRCPHGTHPRPPPTPSPPVRRSLDAVEKLLQAHAKRCDDCDESSSTSSSSSSSSSSTSSSSGCTYPVDFTNEFCPVE